MSGDALYKALDLLVERLSAALESARDVARLARAEGPPSGPPQLTVEKGGGGDSPAFGDWWTACLLAALPDMPGQPAFRKPHTLPVVIRGLRRYMDDRKHTCTPPPSEDLARDLKISKDATQACITYLRLTYWLQTPKNNKRLGKGWRRLTYTLEVPPQYTPPEGPPRPRPLRTVPEPEPEPEQLDLRPPAPAETHEPILDPPTGRLGAPAGGSALVEGSPAAGQHLAQAGMGAGSRSLNLGPNAHVIAVVAGPSGQQTELAGMVSGYQTLFDSLTAGHDLGFVGLESDALQEDVPGQQVEPEPERQVSSGGAAWEPGFDPADANPSPGQHLSTRERAHAFPHEKILSSILLLLGQSDAREAKEEEEDSLRSGEKDPRPAAIAEMGKLTWDWLQLRLPPAGDPDAEYVATEWLARVRDEFYPLLMDESDPAWRRKGGGGQVPWESRPAYWRKALHFLGRGASRDMDAAVKYAVARIAEPEPGTEHARIRDSGYEGGREARGAPAAASDGPPPVLSAASQWKADHPQDLARLQAIAREKLGDAAPERGVMIEVEGMILDVVRDRATVAEIVAAADKRRDARLQAAAKLLEIQEQQ